MWRRFCLSGFSDILRSALASRYQLIVCSVARRKNLKTLMTSVAATTLFRALLSFQWLLKKDMGHQQVSQSHAGGRPTYHGIVAYNRYYDARPLS